MVFDFTGGDVVFKGIVNFYVGVGVSESSGVVGNNVRNFVGSNGLLSTFQEFDILFVFFKGFKYKSSSGIVHDSIGFVGFFDGKNIHNS